MLAGREAGLVAAGSDLLQLERGGLPVGGNHVGLHGIAVQIGRAAVAIQRVLLGIHHQQRLLALGFNGHLERRAAALTDGVAHCLRPKGRKALPPHPILRPAPAGI